MILAATLLWAVETVIARKLLTGMSALTVASAGWAAAPSSLSAYALATTSWGTLAAIGWHQWSWAAATGLILAAYVATWYAALARAALSM